MSIAFAELCAKSNFSFLEGASHPEELVVSARELGLSAIGIADRDGIYGLVRAYRETKIRGIKLVSGAELTIDYGDISLPAGAPRAVTVLVQNHAGYRSLCRILTQAHAHRDTAVARVSMTRLRLSDLEQASTGLELIITTERDMLSAGYLDPCEWGPAWLGVLAAFIGRTHIATFRLLDGLDAKRTDLALRLSKLLCAPIFATSRALYHHHTRKPLADVVYCIRHKSTLDRAGRGLSVNGEAHLRSPSQMAALFRDHHSWVERSAEIAAGLNFCFSELCYRFPCEELCEPGESADEALRRLTYAGLASRYPRDHFINGAPASVVSQCEKELALIAKIGVSAYFLSVHEIVEMARRRRILCQGRGSAANSAVCYALGITAVDPARSNLLFERFLSVERAEPPDIDVDFEHERREEVIQEIYAKYGRGRAAMVSEVVSYRGKSALREVGKAFGLSLDQVDRLSGSVFRYNLGDINERTVREVGIDPSDERVLKAITVARQMEGAPRHLSIHVGGFILSSEPLDNVAPIEPARMEGRTVIPWDKDDIDTLGFFKVDVLGLGMLTCVRKSLELIHQHGLQHRPAAVSPDPFDPIEEMARIPAEDPVVYDAICRADTVGVFQIESRAQMAMLPRLRPRCFYDLVIEVAIVRPGPIQGGMVHPYLRRRTGKEPPRAPHRVLDPILKRTLGVPLFQEQVMQIAMVGAGYSAGEADQLRRDMAAWKKHGRLERHREKLLAGFKKCGIASAFGEALYKQVQGFGEYGFPESHAASFALIVYASSWLKTHHPGLFACALLNSQPMGFYSPSSIVQDAQRHGVTVRAPDIFESNWDNRMEACAGSADSLALRLGFRQISGIGEHAGRAIEKTRQGGRFVSVGDLARRALLKKNELTALAEAGVLEPLESGRRNAMWRAHAPRLDGLYAGCDLESGTVSPKLPVIRPVEQLLLDYGRLGLSIADHPMCHIRPRLSERQVVRASDLLSMDHGCGLKVAGLVIGRQRPQTASGVTFVTLEDETGVVNVVVTVKVFDRYRHAVVHSKLLIVSGKLEREGEVIHLLAHSVVRLELPLPAGAELCAKSRDFH